MVFLLALDPDLVSQPHFHLVAMAFQRQSTLLIWSQIDPNHHLLSLTLVPRGAVIWAECSHEGHGHILLILMQQHIGVLKGLGPFRN